MIFDYVGVLKRVLGIGISLIYFSYLWVFEFGTVDSVFERVAFRIKNCDGIPLLNSY